MTYDKDKEMKDSLAWLERSEGYMRTQDLIYLTATGFDECTRWCASKKYSKDGMCACIRDAFPTLEHYDLYLALSSEVGNLVLANAFAKFIGFPDMGTGEKKKVKDGHDNKERD